MMNAGTLTAGNRPVRIYLLVLFSAIFLLSCLTPMVLDDFTYCFNFADQERMTRLSQLIPSMIAHRQHANGRLVPHAMVQLLLMCRTKMVFNLLNAGNAVLLALLFFRYFQDLRPGAAVLSLCVGAMLIWNFSPSFGESFLWLDGSVNYSWGLSFLLLFLWPYAAAYLELPCGKTRLRTILFLVLAFLAGSYSENGSIATIFAAFCLFLLLWLREKKPRPVLLAGLLMALLGFLWLMTARATAYKSAEMSPSVLAANTVAILADVRKHLILLYALYGLLLAAGLHFRADRRKLIFSGILILSGAASLASFIFAVYFSERHYCFTVVTAALACLLPLSELLKVQKAQLLPRLCAGALSVLFLFNLAAGLVDIAVGFHKSLVRAEAVRAAQDLGETEVWLEEHICFSPYSVSFILSENGRDFPNLGIARYYGFYAANRIEPGS